MEPQQQQQQWSVHAEFTISHPKRGETESSPPQAHTEQGDNGVRMTYTWTTPANQTAAGSTRSTPPRSSTRSYGFQRGNLLFTTTPPRTTDLSPPRRLGVQDSGYGSELSPGTFLQPRRLVQPYNSKCRSTCNIVLSTSIQEEPDEDVEGHTTCGRTQSLRCQTPTLRCNNDRRDNFYGCGDPWCHHLHYADDFSSGRFSPVAEAGEDYPSDQTTSAKTPSTVRCCDRSSYPRDQENKRDASVQTYEMIDKCTSPFAPGMKVSDDKKTQNKKYGSKSRRRTEPIFQRSRSPSTITPDSLESPQVQLRANNLAHQGQSMT